MQQRYRLYRLCGFALLLGVLFGTTGGLLHRAHDAADDNACVVHAWPHFGKSASVTPAFQLPELDVSPNFTPPETHQPAPQPYLHSETARAPPLV